MWGAVSVYSADKLTIFLLRARVSFLHYYAGHKFSPPSDTPSPKNSISSADSGHICTRPNCIIYRTQIFQRNPCMLTAGLECQRTALWVDGNNLIRAPYFISAPIFNIKNSPTLNSETKINRKLRVQTNLRTTNRGLCYLITFCFKKIYVLSGTLVIEIGALLC